MKYLAWAILMLLGLFLVWWSNPARADQPLIQWTQPTTRTDGAPLSLGEIKGTEFQYGTCNGDAFGAMTYAWTMLGTKSVASSPNVQPGTYCYHIRTMTTDGLFSDWSATVKHVVQGNGCTPGCHG
jgi:hypothetical protein